jgi:LmbE family N-acetylglucosaminyl deacetylase
MAERLAVISPHLDDAVWGCGELIAAHPGATVITVFAGMPAASQPLTEWDRGCGFARSREAVLERRREDRAALSVLGAKPCSLEFLDAQYDRPPLDADAIRAALEDTLRVYAPDMIALPLGLFHSDHRLASHGALHLCEDERVWIAYEEAVYRRIDGATSHRLGELAAMGFRVCPLSGRESGTLKARAVRCYASQLRGFATLGLSGHVDLSAAERYWKILRKPPNHSTRTI